MITQKWQRVTLFLLVLNICLYAWSQNNSGGVVAFQGWQNPIQESGKDNNGTSFFICPSSQVMAGRQHSGDENGNTRYKCAVVTFNGVSVAPLESQRAWSNWMQESGKNSGGQSQYQCPQNWVMLGRQHQGDENGNTRYLCSATTTGNQRMVLYPTPWSDPIQESGKNSGGTSSFVCPSQQVMVARRHQGDENGNTWYRCAKFAWSQSPVLTSPPFQSSWIQESGKNSGGTSSFVCPNQWALMIGRSHKGDENGDTMYWCSTPVFVSYTRHEGPWSDWIQESGKNSGGQSSYVCPSGQGMIGREHQGDENGNTRYQCAWIFMQGSLVEFTPLDWGPWIQESGKNTNGQSTYVCPKDTFMIGRQHKGDENGDTRYQCAGADVPYQMATLNSVYQLAANKVGNPATPSPKQFATRSDMGAASDYYLHLDIGGEGFHSVSGVTSGFAGAINVNAQTKDSQPPFNPIPLLIHVGPWSGDPPYPFADQTANYMTLQGAPLTSAGVNEFARVLTYKGNVGLWIDMGSQKQNVDTLARKLNSSWAYSCSSGKSPCSNSCVDEFFGEAGFPKVCIEDHR